MASKIIEKIKEKAEALAQTRKEIEAIEFEKELQLKSLKLTRDTLQEELIEALRKEDLASIKTSEGMTFARAKRQSIEFVNEFDAFEWAYKNRCVSVNKILLKSTLKDLEELPKEFIYSETEYISVRGANKKEDGDNN